MPGPIVVLLVPLLLSLGGFPGPAAAALAAETPALASRAPVPCAAAPATGVLRTYRRGGVRLVLRCGTATWGYRNVVRRWSAAFDAKIALTLARGVVVTDYQQDGGSAIYALFDARCREIFRVIYNAGAYRGQQVRPQGVITAYARPTLVLAQASGPRAGAARTACRVIQDI